MASKLSELERESARILQRLKRLEEITVPSAAKLLKKSPQYIRDHLPVIYHSTRSHHVRVADIEAYQAKRTFKKNGARE